jgi:fluoride exporter
MNNIIFAAIGGAVGSSLRYALTKTIQTFLSNTYYPFATTAINLIGCLAFGIFFALSKNNILSEKMIVFTLVGITGGFTTFALFNFENLQFFQDGKLKLGLLNIIISLAIGTLCIIIGFKVSSFIITALKNK